MSTRTCRSRAPRSSTRSWILWPTGCARAEIVSRAVRLSDRPGGGRRRRRQRGVRTRCSVWRFEAGTAGGAARGAVHRQRRHDCMGGRRAAHARPARHARHRAAARWPLAQDPTSRSAAGRARRTAEEPQAPRHRGRGGGRLGNRARQRVRPRRPHRDARHPRSGGRRAIARRGKARAFRAADRRPGRLARRAGGPGRDAILLVVPAQHLRAALPARAGARRRHAGGRLRQGHRARHPEAYDRGDRRMRCRPLPAILSARASPTRWRAACRRR